MSEGRSVRVLLLANDGSSVGHVVRSLVIAKALRERAGSGRAVPPTREPVP